MSKAWRFDKVSKGLLGVIFWALQFVYTPLVAQMPDSVLFESLMQQVQTKAKQRDFAGAFHVLDSIAAVELTVVQQAALLLRRSSTYEAMGTYDSAIIKSQQGLELLKTTWAQQKILESQHAKSIKLFLELILKQSSFFYTQGNYDLAMQQSQEGIRFADSVKTEYLIIQLYNLRAGTQYSLGNIAAAREEFKSLISLAAKSQDTVSQLRGITNLGIIYFMEGDYYNALDQYALAYELALQNPANQSKNRLVRELGQVYYALNEYDSAQAYFMLDYKATKAASNWESLPIAGANLGDVYRNTRRYDSAWWYYQESLATAKKTGDIDAQVYVMDRLANMYVELDSLPQAIALAREGQKLAANAQLLEERFFTNQTLSQAYVKLGDATAALGYATEARAWADSTGRYDLRQEAWELLYEANRLSGRYQEALQYFVLSQEAEDSLHGEETARETARLEYRMRSERDKIARENEARLAELAYHQELIRQRWIIGFVLLALLALLILVVLYAHFYKRQRQSAAELAVKNRQLHDQNQILELLQQNEKALLQTNLEEKERALASMAMASHEKNKALEALTAQLSRLQEQASPEVQKAFVGVQKQIKTQLEVDDTWAGFLSSFEQVHPDFFKELKQGYPGLTVNELKLCAYIRIGMNNKEIANATNLALSTIKKNLNRLKKKLVLGAEDSIRDFIFKV